MSSLRPLATCALLAAVGGFLYMKINETEPQLPEGVEDWSVGDLQIGGGGDAAATIPALETTPAPLSDAAAPPFVASQESALPARDIATPPAGDAAPPWTPGTTTKPAAPTADSSPVARSVEGTPALPAMPPVPGGNAATQSADASAAVPPLNASATSANTTTAPLPTSVTPPATSAVETPAADAVPKPSMFAAARVAAQGALDRGELAQALSILSEWHGDPSLTPTEAKEVDELLSQLAGSVIYEGPPAHRLAAPHVVMFGETLQTIAAKYDVPWQLLAKINGIADPSKLSQGQELKVIPGPFSAMIDLSERTMTLMLDRRYAGEFAFEIEPTATVEEGEWKVDQKQLTPAISGLYSSPGADTEDRSLRLANLANPAGAPAIVRGPGASDPVSAAPRDRVLKLKTSDMGDVFDILSEGSRVTIRR